MAKLSPIGNVAQFINGVPAVGAKLFFYAAGSSTKQTTYTDEGGLTPQSNPVILDSRGEPTQPIWLTEGQSYKVVFAPSTDTDPPTSPIWDVDDVTGVNDSATTADQWVDSGVTPTYVNATSFTLPGDQTTAFHPNRRFKATVTAGTVYGYISTSVFAALTTVNVTMDSGQVLDSGLSAIQLGILTYDNPSIPYIRGGQLSDAFINDLTTVTADPSADFFSIADISDSGKKKKALLPTATTGQPGIAEQLTAAEIRTGTDTTRFVGAANLLSAQGFTAYFESAQQTITSAGALTIAHGLGRKPILLLAYLICTTAENGYSIGDELLIDGHAMDINTAANRGQAIVADTTNINVRFGNNANAYAILNKTTGAAAVITNANFRLVIRAWG